MIYCQVPWSRVWKEEIHTGFHYIFRLHRVNGQPVWMFCDSIPGDDFFDKFPRHKNGEKPYPHLPILDRPIQCGWSIGDSHYFFFQEDDFEIMKDPNDDPSKAN